MRALSKVKIDKAVHEIFYTLNSMVDPRVSRLFSHEEREQLAQLINRAPTKLKDGVGAFALWGLYAYYTSSIDETVIEAAAENVRAFIP